MPTEETNAWDDATLQAYHDGELGYFARRRVERSLARSPALRRALAEIAAIGDLVRESEAPVTVPNVWEAIAPGLRIADAERDAGAGTEESAGAFGWLGVRVGALVAAGAAAVALAFALFTGDTASHGVVHWVDGGDRNVMLLDGEGDVTVIWVLDPATERALRGGSRGTA